VIAEARNGVVCALPDRSASPDIARYQDESTIREILHTARTVAVVGLSSNVLRPSYFIGFYLQRHGYRIVPVNPREDEILGQRSYPSLSDMVDVFRAPEAVPTIAEEAVKIGAGALWLQFGVISHQGARIAEEADLKVVMDRCMKVEHARHLGRMHWLGFNTGVVTSRR
jgi:predicted CoA-binding protein